MTAQSPMITVQPAEHHPVYTIRIDGHLLRDEMGNPVVYETEGEAHNKSRELKENALHA